VAFSLRVKAMSVVTFEALRRSQSGSLLQSFCRPARLSAMRLHPGYRTRSDAETLQKNHVKSLAIAWLAPIASPPMSAIDDMEEVT